MKIINKSMCCNRKSGVQYGSHHVSLMTLLDTENTVVAVGISSQTCLQADISLLPVLRGNYLGYNTSGYATPHSIFIGPARMLNPKHS